MSAVETTFVPPVSVCAMRTPKDKKFGRPALKLMLTRYLPFGARGFRGPRYVEPPNVSRVSTQRSVAQLPKSDVLMASTV